jgi:regulator of sigma E protease
MSFSFLAIIFVFGLLVLIHELGHFLAAKWMGVRVERFSIGFPPRLFGKKIGDTDYCISAIPLGGYVKMSGMIDESLDDNLTGADYEFNSKPVWQRVVIIVAGVVMNFFLAILILTLVNFINGEQIIPTTDIGFVGKEGIAHKIGFEEGDKILSIQGQVVHTWNDIQSEFIRNLNDNITFKVLRRNEQVELIYKKEWFREKNAELLDIAYMPTSTVGMVLKDMPAERAGLVTGDHIIAIDGIPVNNWSEMTEIIKANADKELSVTYRRGQDLNTLKIVPDGTEETDSSGVVQSVGKIGIGVYYERHQVGFFRAVEKGIKGTFTLLSLNIKGLWWVINGTKPASEVIGGPIMIAKLAQDAASEGWEQLWSLTAALSAILAFFNILPIPALDGGHLVFLLIEAITRKPVSTRAKILVQQVGMAVLLTLIVFILYIDIRRLLF